MFILFMVTFGFQTLAYVKMTKQAFIWITCAIQLNYARPEGRKPVHSWEKLDASASS